MADVDTDFGYDMCAVTIETSIALVTDNLLVYNLWKKLADAASSRFSKQPFVLTPEKVMSLEMDSPWMCVESPPPHQLLGLPDDASALVTISTRALEPVEQHKDVLTAFVKWAKAEGVTWYIQFDDVWRQETLPEFGEDEW